MHKWSRNFEFINPFVFILRPILHLWFSDVFRRCKIGALAKTGLIEHLFSSYMRHNKLNQFTILFVILNILWKKSLMKLKIGILDKYVLLDKNINSRPSPFKVL